MIEDLRHSSQKLFESDILIVGSGPAGISLALEFNGTNQNVILLESGGTQPLPEYETLNTGKNTGPLFLDLSNSRKRCFGGASKIWAGVCRPLDTRDFSKRDYLPLSGWPITKEELDPYYKKSATLLEIDGSILESEGWDKKFESGINFPFDKSKDSNVKGKLLQQVPLKNRDFGQRFEPTFAESKNIKVLMHGTLTNLELSASNNSVNAVEVSCLSGKKVFIRAKKIVLACGALENPRILLLANKSKNLGLGNGGKNVGRYFMSHPGFSSVSQLLKQDDHACNEKASSNLDLYRKTFEFRENFNSQKSLLGHNFVVEQANKSYLTYLRNIRDRWNSRKLNFKNLSAIPVDFPYASAANDLYCKAQKKDSYHLTWSGGVSIEQAPNPSSRVTLSDEKDIFGQNKINFHWDKISDIEKQTVHNVVRHMALELGRLGLGRLRIENRLKDESVFEVSDSINHQMGTTRMAHTAQHGVVDKNCKVFGIQNLYVAGGSVFATSGSVNPTFTVIALALRLADHLKKLV